MAFVIGDDVAARVAAYETQFGNRTVEIYGNTIISAATLVFEGYDALLSGADTYADYTLTWVSSSDSVIVELGGHLAVGLDPLHAGIGYGEGRGAASISGGPYHFKLHQLDGGSLGNQDNQIQGAAIKLPAVACHVTPEGISVCAGGSATFTDQSVGGTRPYTWEWTKPPATEVLSTDSTLTISAVTVADEGEYQVVVTDFEGLSDTCRQYLTVYDQPSCSLACPDPAPECQSSGNVLIACVEGDIVACAWSLTGDGWYIEEACADTLVYCVGSGAGAFKLVITDVHGCQDSSEIICECDEMVPVELTGFQAVGGEHVIVVSWSTASEVNCQGWEVHRGDQKDGQYVRVGQLPGYGSTETGHSYRWVDRQVQPGAIYFYKLRQLDLDGGEKWSWAVSATAGAAMPAAYAIEQNYPNPFNASSQIRYQIAREGYSTLKIYNTLGEQVRTLVDQTQEPGWYVVTWDGRNNKGAEVSSGLYICRLKTGDFSDTIKMVLLR
jgi:hypothetical protein